MRQNGLHIYKASAGSGKTFSLVGEYLKLLFEQPFSYKNILAVTFTNKATSEMKKRILLELNKLSKGGHSGYLVLLEEYGNEQQIRKKSGEILRIILHDYSRFSVMTIDSFFQRVIRAFAREISLNATFRTEIDDRQVLEEAVDLLFQEIDENKLLMDWMVKFLEDNLEEGKNWDFRKELLQFGNEVNKEAFKVHGDRLLESLSRKELLGLYILKMKGIISAAELRMKQFGRDGLEMIATEGLTYDQFKDGKNSFCNLFNKLLAGKLVPPTQTMLNARDNLDRWYKNSDSNSTKAAIEKLYHKGLNRILVDAMNALEEEIYLINSASVVLKNIYPFGLLGNIALKMKEVLAQNNMVLLSDSGRMIGKIIEGNDTPFIYEKVGLIYHHFMLDEFQDTSRQQWNNFKPLVENAVSSGNLSLVVGDIKQSIYRWRNGDWNLLANQLASDLSHQVIVPHELNTNYRSKKNIVDFNNAIFNAASTILNKWFEDEADCPDLNDIIANAYAGQFQQCFENGEQKGHVRVTFVDSTDAKTKIDFREKALVMLIAQLEEVQLSGVKPEEITILVRENSEAEKIAKALWKRKKAEAIPGCIYDVITSDTLKIGQSPVVRFVINFLRLYTGGEFMLLRAEILYGFYRILRPMRVSENVDNEIDLHGLFDANSPLPELFLNWLDADSSSEFIADLLSLPLFELSVRLAEHFQLGMILGEKAFLQAFFDMVLDYVRVESNGIVGFLSWWDSSGSNKTLNLPLVRNFMRISSIHQSKGLEFDTVFVPFCNWEVALNSHKSNYLWAVPKSEPFNDLELVLVKCDSKLKNTIFSSDFCQELLLSLMDNLNLLYVALTRAVNNLFLIMPYKNGNQKIALVSDVIQKLMDHPFLSKRMEQDSCIDLTRYWNPQQLLFEMGHLENNLKSKDFSSLAEENLPLLLNSNCRMKIRLHSKDYFLLTGNLQAERINKGTVMHQIFERIKTLEDVGFAVNQVVGAGLISKIEGDEYKTEINSLLEKLPYSEWFSNQWNVLNERDILRSGESKHRPDRVLLKEDSAIVIDYKTGEKSKNDILQMQGYLHDLNQMGYSHISGNIWYLHKNEVVKIEFTN